MMQNKHNECAMYTGFQLLWIANKSISVYSVFLVTKLYKLIWKAAVNLKWAHTHTPEQEKKMESEIWTTHFGDYR